MSGILGNLGGIRESLGGLARQAGNNSVFSLFYGNILTELGLLQLDVLVTENLTFPSEVTKYPIEDGSEISDHITKGSEELNITGAITSAMDWSLQFGSCKSKLIEAVDTLRKMHEDRKVVKIVTGMGTYEDMGFTALSFNRSNSDKGGNWIDINASLRKVVKVQLKQADLPEDTQASKTDGASGKVGKTEAKSGTSGAPSKAPEAPSERTSLWRKGTEAGVIPGKVGPR